MSRKTKHYLHVVTEFKNGHVIDYKMVESDAHERFIYLVRLAVEVGFDKVRSIRLESAHHVLYEYRDLRSIVKQENLLDYGF